MTDATGQRAQRGPPPATKAQKAAIAHRRGEMVVLAGAGAGKTATLANRCAELVTDPMDTCDVRELLVLTFTREAADEMRSRIARALRQAAANETREMRTQHLRQQAALVDTAQISTFHGFCNWVAKTWFMFCHVDPDFSVLNEHEAAMLQTDALREATREFMARQHPQYNDFIEIFDLYAGASLARLETLTGPVLRAMETVVDPETWCSAVAATGDAEIRKVIAAFIARTCRRLNELALMLSAGSDEARLYDADGKKAMYSGLLDAAKASQGAAGVLREKGVEGWLAARGLVATVIFSAQIRLRDTNDQAQAAHFRDGTYKPLKQAFEALRDELVGLEIAALALLEITGRRRIATILAFAAAVRRRYQTAKAARRQLDYSDLERTIIAALSAPDNPLKVMLHQRFRHILVDEYQDINPVQQRLIELLYRGDTPGGELRAGGGVTGQHSHIHTEESPDHLADAAEETPVGNQLLALRPRSLFGVGDVLQSIYGFRGSEPRILHDRVMALRSADQADKVITMRENFRTLPALIDALNAIIQPMMRMVDDISAPDAIRMAELAALSHGRLAESAGAASGAPVHLHVIVRQRGEPAPEEDSDDTEAVYAADGDDPITQMQADEIEATRIGQLILEMLNNGRRIGPESRPLEFKDIAILLRAPSQRAPHYVRRLIAMGINANAALTTGFFESGEVLEVLDILRVLDNPDQDIAMAGVLIGPIGGCTPAELAQIRRAGSRQIAFHQAVLEFASQHHTDAAAVTLAGKISGALNKLEHWRAMLRSEKLVHALARILREGGFLNRAAAMSGGRQRLANLRLLQQRAMEFSGFDMQSLSRFLTFFDRLRDERDLGEAAPPAGNAVRIMSIHGSKGLEFPVVFVAALGASFNKRDLHQWLLVDRDKGVGLTILDDNGVLKQESPGRMMLAEEKLGSLLREEARLLYVAMTRARDELILVGAMEQSAIEKWPPVNSPGGSSGNGGRPALKPAACPLAWLGPIFSQYQSAGVAEPLLKLQITSRDDMIAAAVPTLKSPPDAIEAAEVAPTGAVDPRAEQTDPAGELRIIFNRITQAYPHAEFTRLPAVSSVSRLKSLDHADSESPAFILDAPADPVRLNIATQGTGAQKGLIMHSVLQRLDLTRKITAESLHEALASLVDGGFLTPAESRQVDHNALLWLFGTPLGQRLQMAAANANHDIQLRREISFLWSVPADEVAPDVFPAQPGDTGTAKRSDTVAPASGRTSEQMLIRGTIDVLLIEPEGLEIIDYKTDAAALIESRLPAYTRQVGYYARAAAAILNKPVQKTSLIFFSARRIHTLRVN